MQIETRVRKWGNSLGIVIPKEIVDKEGLEEGEEVLILSVKRRKNIGDLYGSFKGWNLDTQKWKDELREQETKAEERKQNLFSRQLRSDRDSR